MSRFFFAWTVKNMIEYMVEASRNITQFELPRLTDTWLLFWREKMSVYYSQREDNNTTLLKHVSNKKRYGKSFRSSGTPLVEVSLNDTLDMQQDRTSIQMLLQKAMD